MASLVRSTHESRRLLATVRGILGQGSVVLVPGPIRDPFRWANLFLHYAKVSRCLILSLGEGSHVEMSRDIEVVRVRCAGDSPLQRLQDYCRSIKKEVGVRRVISEWDPEGAANVVFSSFMRGARSWNGRRCLGGRSQSWRDIEDKGRQVGLWSMIGVESSRYTRVGLRHHAALRRACSEMDQGGGAVVSLAGSDLNAAGEGTFRVDGNGMSWSGRRDLRSSWGAVARSARIMPHFDGVPCSVHGVVTADGVAVLPPSEQVIGFDQRTSRFVYRGIRGPLLGPTGVVADLIAVARRVGECIRQAPFGYRGAFSLDAIATEEGEVVPTEINSRMSDGFWVASDDQEVPIALIDLALKACPSARVDVPSLELELRRGWYSGIRWSGVPAPAVGHAASTGTLAGPTSSSSPENGPRRR